MSFGFQTDRRGYIRTAAGAAIATMAFATGAAAGEGDDRNDPGCAFTGFDSPWGLDPDRKLLPGTKFETGVYERGSDENGPTAVVVAGQHGIELSAQHAALQLTNVAPRVGKLVLVPLANVPAIEQHRYSTEDGNLNRDFPSGREPTSKLARAIWDEITSHDPDVAFDLHSSAGVYADDNDLRDGVGQAVFPTPAGADTADRVIDALNEQYVYPSEYVDGYEFTRGNLQTGYNPLLSHKYGGDLDIPAWLIETTRYETTLPDRIAWHVAAVVGCLQLHGFKFDCGPTAER